MFDRNAQLLGIETSKARSVRTTLRRLWAYFRKYLLILILVTVALLASTYMQVLIPDLIGQAVDCYLGPFSAGSQISVAKQRTPCNGDFFEICLIFRNEFSIIPNILNIGDRMTG